MKLLLIIVLSLAFLASCFASAYESKPGMPKNNQ